MSGPANEAPAAAPGDPLAALEAQAVQLEQGAPGAAPAAPPGPSVADEAREVVEVAASLLLPFLPERIAVRYGEKELQRIGEALGTVAEKRGWSVGGFLAGYGAELALAAALAGPVLPVLIAEAKARKAKPAEPERPADGALPVEAPTAPAPVDDDNPQAGQRVL